VLLLGGKAPVLGAVDATMNETALTAAFGHPVARRLLDEHVVFVAL
jgi:hypothetical protein